MQLNQRLVQYIGQTGVIWVEGVSPTNKTLLSARLKAGSLACLMAVALLKQHRKLSFSVFPCIHELNFYVLNRNGLGGVGGYNQMN